MSTFDCTGRALVLASILVALVLTAPAAGAGFLINDGTHGSGIRSDALEEQLQRAIGEALGCGSSEGHQSLPAIKERLLPVWRTLPKNSRGRVERRTLRLAVHRYFMGRSQVSIKGFEPSRPANTSSWGADDIISQRVPGFVERVLDGAHSKRGFKLDDIATVIATIEQLIFDSESSVLEQVYSSLGLSTRGSLKAKKLQKVLERYMLRWLVGEVDEEGEEVDFGEMEPAESIPHWKEVEQFLVGQQQQLAYGRFRAIQHSGAARAGGASRRAFNQEFSFQDAHDIVGSITQTFGPFWEDVCQDMKRTLVELDHGGTGRVKMADFYAAGLKAEWRFGESEIFLRELGALDESSRWHGKQVIIPNYLQAGSNCIVSSAHYSVCCANECEQFAGEIEAAIRKPVAEPEEVLSVVGNLTSAAITNGLESQLRQIARAHHNKVPIHGRLFAQWLHYVFPRECPFPHKVGTAKSHAHVTEFGEGYLATKEEMVFHASGRDNATAKWEAQQAAPADSHWMSQWSPEEELQADYSGHLRAPWEAHYSLLGAVGVAACGAALWLLGVRAAGSENEGCGVVPVLSSGGAGRRVHMV